MNRISQLARTGLLAGVLALTVPACAEDAATPTEPLSEAEIKERLGYATGHNIGSQMRGRMPIEIDAGDISSGLEDALDGKPARFSQQQIMAAQTQLQATLTARQDAITRERFEAEAANPAVKRTESGIYYEVLQAGTGASPSPDSTVTAHYVGRLLDGSQFDSSRDRGEPSSFPLTGVIPGWQEILPMMKTGGRWRVVIPFELAYGESGRPPTIPPRAALEFDIELVSFE